MHVILVCDDYVVDLDAKQRENSLSGLLQIVNLTLILTSFCAMFFEVLYLSS
jgi:hypothetical protein